MIHSEARRCIVDYLGSHEQLAVDIDLSVDDARRESGTRDLQPTSYAKHNAAGPVRGSASWFARRVVRGSEICGIRG